MLGKGEEGEAPYRPARPGRRPKTPQKIGQILGAGKMGFGPRGSPTPL